MHALTEAARRRLIFALDLDDLQQAMALADDLRGEVGWIKVGLRLHTRAGPEIVQSLLALGHHVFLDLKFHDIPDQVAGACRAAARLGAGILTVHGSGGRAMLTAAAEGAAEGARAAGFQPPAVLAITVLTSLDSTDLADVGVSRPLDEQVLGLAGLAAAAGCAGVVASPRELGKLRAAFPSPFRILTPGIRPAGTESGDQKRVLGPEAAVEGGADWLVVGRPIQQAPDPAAAARAIVQSMALGEARRAP